MSGDYFGSSKTKKLVVLACGLTSYGPLVQGLMFLADTAFICREASISLEIVSENSFTCAFERLYGFSTYGVKRFSLSAIDRILLSTLLGRLLFSSIIVPLVRPGCSLIYLDDTSCIIPFRRPCTLIHSPSSAFSYSRLKQSCVSVGCVRHFLQRLYLLWIAHVAKTSFFVQSSMVARSLARQLYIDYSTVEVIDIERMARKWHPLLGENVSDRNKNTILHGSGHEEHRVCADIESILKAGFSRIVFSCCSPRSHKNPLFIVEVARKAPSFAFVCTLPTTFFSAGSRPSNLFAIGPVSHCEALRWIAHDLVALTFFPSRMETYGLPILESVILEKPCVIPSEPFFDVHTSTYALRYRSGDSDHAAELISSLGC